MLGVEGCETEGKSCECVKGGSREGGESMEEREAQSSSSSLSELTMSSSAADEGASLAGTWSSAGSLERGA